ncbi:TM2 domain-containing protein [Flavobacterium orientale]|uniref:TM2 domain-containing protein n=1 Tax=Flavobacterium orientale TaxID=1756020 RepID=A0A916XWG5_9FLAO|nr:TM2 domain-containing protein [Flavobacterium orientale]GGD18192.1 hypothetical protein GCM10011343_06020 [Flavobacterium orientale]
METSKPKEEWNTSKPKEEWNTPSYPKTQPENKKIVAGVLALLLGGIGIHKFVLGYTQEGIIQIILSLVSCGILGIIPFIEGIIYLVKTDEEFYHTYQVNKRGWF